MLLTRQQLFPEHLPAQWLLPLQPLTQGKLLLHTSRQRSCWKPPAWLLHPNLQCETGVDLHFVLQFSLPSQEWSIVH